MLAEQEIAWIDDGARRFVARAARPGPGSSASAVTRLIQGVYVREPAQARRILRLRIRTTALTPSEMCWGMVRVAAKRLECGVEFDAEGWGGETIELPAWQSTRSDASDPLPFGLGEPSVLAGARPMATALALAAHMPRSLHRYQSDRPIAAVLTDADDRILAWATNASAGNKTLHAEIVLVQGYCQETHGALPRGARVYTTLKCCKMCAGMIWTAAADPLSIRVTFAEDDPGPRARLTVLTPGSFERERARPGSREVLEFSLQK